MSYIGFVVGSDTRATQTKLDDSTRKITEHKSVLIFGSMFDRRSYFMMTFTDLTFKTPNSSFLNFGQVVTAQDFMV